MGFLLIFFPEEESNKILNKNKFSSSSSSFLNRTNSSQILSKAQFTISVCALLVFLSLLFFTLSTFEPTASPSQFLPRRQLYQISAKTNRNGGKNYPNPIVFPHALQGLGSLYRRGTKPMTDLIVAHIVESLNLHELKLFLRLLHKSILTSKSDVVFVFPSESGLRSNFDASIAEESDSFLKLVDYYQETIIKNSTASFERTQFLKWSRTEKESGETIWGRRIRSNRSDVNGTESSESTRLSYGSLVGFNADELDLENSLSGFLEHIPMSLRRWACYVMLLGRVKRNYKHIVLVDAKEILLLGDPLSRVRTSSPESVYLSSLYAHSPANKHTKRNSEKTQSTRSKSITPSIIIGGARGVRRLSNAMLNEIVRMSIQPRKKRNSVTELGVFNQLVTNEFLLNNVRLMISTESIPELSSLAESTSKPGSIVSASKLTVLRRGNSNFGVNSTALKHILCSSSIDFSFYSDC